MSAPPKQQASLAFDGEGSMQTYARQPRLVGWTPECWPVANDWRPVVDAFLSSEAGRRLERFIQARLANGATIYPPQPFHALALTALAQVKVLILGQDPYHGPGQAHGLAFSVPPGVRPPPSLRNIFKEIARDTVLGPASASAPVDGSLARWATQGVLLLNTCLTVEDGQAASHAGRGWDVLTDAIVQTLACRRTPLVFLLWGAHAQARQALITACDVHHPQTDPTKPCHLVLTANHPSPLSALRPPIPFLGCGHFSRANAFLQAHGGTPIVW